MNQTSDAVKASRAAIGALVEAVNGDMSALDVISTQIHASMAEITVGTQDINQAVSSISDASVNNRLLITQVEAAVGRFKTESTEVVASVPDDALGG